MRIAFAGAVGGFIGLVALYSWHTATATLVSHIIVESTKYGMTVIPLFVFMGYLGFYSGLGEEIYRAGRAWFGKLPGGLAIGTVFGCAGFGAISGSSTAAVAMFGRMSVPEMDRYNYHRRLSVGTIAASGTLATLIPPSTTVVIYGLLAEQSIGKLLIAGFLPGIVSAIIYGLMIYFRAVLNPKLGPPGPSSSLKEKFISLRSLWAVVAIMLVILGGLYTGVFTPTEAGGFGAFAMFILVLIRRMLTWEKLKAALLEATRVSCMIFIVIIGVRIFMTLLVASGVTGALVKAVLTLPVPAEVMLLGILVVYVIFGCFIGVIGMLVTTIPFVYPVILGLGFNPIWFGIIVIKLCEVAMITPPVGINVFVASKVIGEPVENCFRGVIPFFFMDLLTIGVLIAFPQIILFLPNLM